MKKSTKAALYSCFVFPGAGLYWLKLYKPGSLFFIPACVAVVYILQGLATVSAELNAQVALNPNAYMDFAFLINAVSVSIANNIPYLQHAKWLFIASWVMSIFSSYFAGKKSEETNE
jgi:hypothetical protein